jgi:transcriptional regulator with XRE-family HTH domain
VTDVAESPGSAFRRVRRQRHLTLVKAAALMSTSPSALSRLERGLRLPDRLDIDAAVDAYDLAPWEVYFLYSISGLLPSALPQLDDEGFVRYAAKALASIVLPAMVVDRVGYFLMWNDALRATLSLEELPLPHPIHGLFSQAVRNLYGDGWHEYAVRSLRLFYARTLPIANDASFHQLLVEMEDTYGPEFVAMWHEAQDDEVVHSDTVDKGLLGVETYVTPYGPADYLVTNTIMRPPSMMELYVFVPFGHSSVQIQSRIDKLTESGRIHSSGKLASTLPD